MRLSAPTPFQIVSTHFRAQPLIDAGALHEVRALELLHRGLLPYEDPDAMLEVDIRALESAALLARECGCDWRIHCNVEISSLLNSRWMDAMLGHMCPGVVVEIVERNGLLADDRALHKVALTVDGIRRFGGSIALDDVTGTPIEWEAIVAMQPEIIKVESTVRIDRLKGRSSSTLVIERIETEDQARDAKEQGFDELQGYWCDVRAGAAVPIVLTPPGIAFFAELEAPRRAA